MLREEQIDIRRQRARAARLSIENTGKNRVFSDFTVSNPDTGGQYTVTIRGFELGNNTCTCPDFKSNQLGTCKHIEAVLEQLRDELPAHVLKKKAALTRPEISLNYGEQLQLQLHLPPRHSDRLAQLARRFFDERGLWNGQSGYAELLDAIGRVPEEVVVFADALDFMDRETDRASWLAREAEWLAQLDRGEFPADLLRVPLYDYQLRGAIFLACRGRCILADDMGLGKTAQTLAAAELLHRERGIGRVLIVAPASVKYQWESEIRRFTQRAVQVIEGGPDDRKDQYAQPTFYRLVNYEQIVRDREWINEWKPDLIVLDEAQRIKNWVSKTSQEVKKLRSRYAIALTGTPLENRLEELYSIVQFVDERRFGPAYQFLHDHRVLDEHGQIAGYRGLDRIREKLAPIFLRRTRGEVLAQLPARTDSLVFVELSDEQRPLYEEQHASLARLLHKPFLSEIDRKRALACLVNLRMVCNSTFLLDRTTRHSPKLDEWEDLLPELLGEHKIVVFSQWETMIQLAAEILDRRAIPFVMLHGNLSGHERKAVLERFAQEAACRVFLSTDAGSTGLNLQTADTVVNLELPWNPAVLEQRIARVHRMGQQKPVRVVNFVTRGTIEEKVLRTLERKQQLFTELFAGDDEEIVFRGTDPGAFLAALKHLVAEPAEREPPSEPLTPWTPASQFVAAAAAMLETLPEMLAAVPLADMPGDLRQRVATAARKLLAWARRPEAESE